MFCTTTPLQPFLKWAGGKRVLLPEIQKHLPSYFGVYYEPFLGAGAVLFALQPPRAVVGDINAEIINCYVVIRDQVEALITQLARHKNEEQYFYAIRAWDRTPTFLERDPVERAARILFLNKTCYNGLYRVNAHGQFNVPFGRYAAPRILDAQHLRAVSRYLNDADITIRCGDFAATLAPAQTGDFVYCDPPYDPISPSASFTGYAAGGFPLAEQVRLRDTLVALDARGVQFLLSNAATPRMQALYQHFAATTVSAPRAINSNATKRGAVEELLVRNY